MKWESLGVRFVLTSEEVKNYRSILLDEEREFYGKLFSRFLDIMNKWPLESRKIAIVSLPEEIDNECINVIQLLAGKDRKCPVLFAFARSISINKVESDLSFLCILAKAFNASLELVIGSFHEEGSNE